MRDYRTHRPGSYQEMTSGFRWEVPASYNLAADVLDKHEPDRPAMHFVSDEGRDERWTLRRHPPAHRPHRQHPAASWGWARATGWR